MIDLTPAEQRRYLWHFLLLAAKNQIPIAPEAFHKLIPENSDDLAYIGKAAFSVAVVNFENWLGTSKQVNKLSPDQFNELSNNVKEFPKLRKEETPIFNLLVARYCMILHSRGDEFSTLNHAFAFWETLDWNKIEGPVFERLTDYLYVLGPENYDRERVDRSVVEYAMEEFAKFTASHAHLIIYEKGYSERVARIDEIRQRSDEALKKAEKANVKADTHISGLEQESASNLKQLVEKYEKDAENIIQTAKDRVVDSSLSEFVKRFEEDASKNEAAANRWFIFLLLSFGLILVSLSFFLGQPHIITRLPSTTIDHQIKDLVLWIIGTTVLFAFLTYLAKNPWKIFETSFGRDLKKSTLSQSFISSATIMFNTAAVTIPLVGAFYIFAVTFHFEILGFDLDAGSFILAKKQSINWAAFASSSIPRIFLLGLALSITTFCTRMYRIQKHLEAENRYRSTALSAYKIFAETLDGSKEAEDRRNKLFDELASLIYSPINTGFQDSKKAKGGNDD